MTTIDEFNEEETSFGLELSQYPQRKQIHDKLIPFKKLYDNSSEFIENNNLWLNSTIGSFDPEDIESDVTQYYRNIYKLEKFFVDKEATCKLATDVFL